MNELIKISDIQNKIFLIRGLQVMLDNDLAHLYGVEIRVLNQAVKRNITRFPEYFRFQITQEEYMSVLRSQNVILERGRGKHRKYLPYVFTEQGVAMLSAVLRSETAINVSIQIMQAFVEMKKFISINADMFYRLETIEKRQISYQIETEQKFEQIFKALEDKSIKPKQGIFYNGQVFDAYLLIADIIKSAKKSIILIDNYVDETV
ncbi:MAG: ORF6N domain-containing protein, partial [Candidatus Cloacimonetes bacterium]|nr:ORF6N domain-containing protein [Candidatus Cloacimonadota bacterium]